MIGFNGWPGGRGGWKDQCQDADSCSQRDAQQNSINSLRRVGTTLEEKVDDKVQLEEPLGDAAGRSLDRARRHAPHQVLVPLTQEGA